MSVNDVESRASILILKKLIIHQEFFFTLDGQPNKVDEGICVIINELPCQDPPIHFHLLTKNMMDINHD